MENNKNNSNLVIYQKYLEFISKEEEEFNLQISPKSFNIFNVINHIEV